MSDGRRPAVGLTAVERWSLPQVEGPVVGRVRDDRKAIAAAEALAAAARQENLERGYQEGLARARAETQTGLDELTSRIKRLDCILQLLAQPLQDLDTTVEKQLAMLALTVGKQLARRELRIDPAQVIAIIRESLSQLPAAAREIRVHLHPDDAAAVRERLAAPGTEQAWTMVEDPTLSRGGCVVRTPNSQIDVRLESRVNAVIASVLGDERSIERDGPKAENAAMTQQAGGTP